MAPEPRFLTAEWRDLAMLNYEVDPSILATLIPTGCELDLWRERAFVSVVGFRFLRTRVLGIAIPFHRDFDEVNLRFYVRRNHEGTWRRGVVFVKELVPRRAVAFVARTIYGENYVALPMRHAIEPGSGNGLRTLAYEWRRGSVWESLTVETSGTPFLPAEDAEESFITEHYWGYARKPNGGTVEYQVEHPRWSVWRASRAGLSGDVTTLYGPAFSEGLSGAPSTAFVADGSPIVVRRGRLLRGE